MLLQITNTAIPATNLGFILHKNPDKVHTVKLNFGIARVFYPEATENTCTATLLLEINPIDLVRTRKGPAGQCRTLDQYVNDRPYVASSHMSVALSKVYGTAMSGRCKMKPELVDQKLPLVIEISVLPCRGGERLLHGLFEPLSYEIETSAIALDEKFPEWGQSPYFKVRLSGEVTVKDMLSHLYVMIPVLDNNKHYWVSEDEIEKLLNKGANWLPTHPEREVIVNRYLKYRKRYTQLALSQLVPEEVDPAGEIEEKDEEETIIEKKISLNQYRIDSVRNIIRDADVSSLIDLGCGEGKYLREFLKEKNIRRLVGMDVSYRTLEIAKDRLHWERMPDKQKERIELIQGSLMYRDKRISGFDAAVCIEVIEHLDPPRLAAFERVLFEFAKPKLIVITTPNVEYNECFENLPAGKYRHRDHRFEWTRKQFQDWAETVSNNYSYAVEFHSVGDVDPKFGSPTQMGVFSI